MKREKIKKLKESGVTMLSLVVTIIVLLILAGITIKFALNDNGIIKQSKLASEKYKNSTIQEQIAMNETIKEMQKTQNEIGGGSSSGNTTINPGSSDDDLKQQIEDLQNEVENLTDQINALQTQKATGNAKTSDVLSGETFSTSTGIGLTGTMKNNGAWTASSSGSGKLTIPQGYHNGQGYVNLSGSYNQGYNDAIKATSKIKLDYLGSTNFTVTAEQASKYKQYLVIAYRNHRRSGISTINKF